MPNLEGLDISNKSGEQGDSPYRIIDFSESTGKNPNAIKSEVVRHNYDTLWTYAVNAILGCWLIANPHLFDYRSAALATSDTVCGALIIIIEAISFSARFSMVRWGTAAIAVWLLFAPLVFWSPTPAVFLVDTLVALLSNYDVGDYSRHTRIGWYQFGRTGSTTGMDI